MTTINVPFERWKDAAGFPPEFPRLGTLQFAAGTEDPRLYSPRELREKRLEVVQRLHRGELQVVVPIGHGATTIARWVVNHVERECLAMRMIPVLVSLDDLVDEAAAWAAIEENTKDGAPLLSPPAPTDGLTGSCAYVVHKRDGTSKIKRKKIERSADKAAGAIARAALDGIDSAAVLDETVHAAVVRSLVTNQWERVISEYRYASLLGADRSDTAALQSRREQLLPLVLPFGDASIDWATLGELSPQLADRAALVDVLQKNGIRITLSLDLSCTRFGRFAVRDDNQIHQSRDVETEWFQSFVVERFLVHFKSQRDASAGFFGGLAGEGGVVSVTQYLSEGTAAYFNSVYSSSATRLETYLFDPLDVFTIVASHYPLDRTDKSKPELVSSVMGVGVIERVATASGLALTSMVHLLDDRLSSLDQVTYHLQLPEFEGLPDRVTKLTEDLKKLTGRVDVVERRVDDLGPGRTAR